MIKDFTLTLFNLKLVVKKKFTVSSVVLYFQVVSTFLCGEVTSEENKNSVEAVAFSNR